MKNNLILLCLIFHLNLLFSQQENDTWIKFEGADTYLIGYKDQKGEVRIEPKFTFLTNAEIFKNIIPVFEETNLKGEDSKIKQYYLLKNGKQIGRDSLYVYDTTLDCENENKIRFWDPKTDKVGFFDGNGNIVIPAVYDNAQPFYNGFSVVIKDGKRICADEVQEKEPCEHWSWFGNIQIINDKNQVVADHVPSESLNGIDWFSVKKNSTEANENEITFLSPDGGTYSFLNVDKEFENWYRQNFLKQVSDSNINSFLFEKITYDANEAMQFNKKIKFKDSFWKTENREEFLKNNKGFLLKMIQKYKESKTVISTGMTPLLFKYEEMPQYFSDCGVYQNIKFPYFRVYLLNKNKVVLNTISFIKTEKEFRLLEIFRILYFRY
ncbi:WG repeat-containing protein [Flavobacterium sp. HTF]|uniref:WG repeat-containing protein n=1 Tax=Flavobacterium sp. HTF TaxID=2170732 RepID=UPI001A9C4ABE|nr:WG repeat-containing protein [Flavobacterium sp. HTF]